MAESAGTLEATRSLGERILDELNDPFGADRQRAEVVRFYRQDAGASLVPDVIAQLPEPGRREMLRGLIEDRNEIAAWAARAQNLHVEGAIALGASDVMGAIHGLAGSGWVTAAVGGAAGLAAVATDNSYLRAAAVTVFVSAASSFAYQAGVAIARPASADA